MTRYTNALTHELNACNAFMHALEGKRTDVCGGVFAMNGDDTAKGDQRQRKELMRDCLRRSWAIAQRRKVAYTPTMHVRSLRGVSDEHRAEGRRTVRAT